MKVAEKSMQLATHERSVGILKRFYVGSTEKVSQNHQESESEDEEVTDEGC